MTETLSFEQKENLNENLKCSKRPEVVNEVIENLDVSFEKLGIENWTIPETEIIFKKPTQEQKPLLGRVEVENEKSVIFFDTAFSTKQGEEKYTKELNEEGMDYPGMVGKKGTLKHELAHIAMWSVTGIDRQPATRLIDEGFANLVQETTQEGLPKEKFKKEIKDGLNSNQRENFEKALDFEKTLPERKELNAADSKVGAALLIWVHEKYGVEKMIELITKSPSISKNSNEFVPSELDSRHEYKEEYEGIMRFFKEGLLTKKEAEEKAKQWEAKQFSTALKEITKFETTEKVKKEFLQWIQE